MENKTITTRQYNKLLSLDTTIKQKGIKLIKSKTRLYIGMGVFAVAVITPFTNWALMPLSLMIAGLSMFDLKHIYIPKIKRKLKYKLRSFWS